MAIVVRNRKVIALYYGNRVVRAVYKGPNLIWSAALSCFGSGYWIGNRPWSATEAWKSKKQ